MTRIALVGNLSVDTVAGGAPRAGGGVFWAARAAASVGVEVAIATRCAPADRAVALEPLLALGLPVVWRDAQSTVAFSFVYDGDGREMRVDAVGDPWTPDDVAGWAADALADAEWVHVAGLLRSDFPADTISALARDDRRLLLDAQGIVRLGQVGPLAVDGNADPRIFGKLAILTLNEEEADVLAGGTAAERLRSLGVREVVLTLASRGSVVVTPDAAVEVAARRVEGTVDPTGAGDSFALVYLDARAEGAAPVEAAERASNAVADLIARP